MPVKPDRVHSEECPVDVYDLYNPLDHHQREVVLQTFLIYACADPGDQVMKAIRAVDHLGERVLEEWPEPQPKSWHKDMQRYIEWLAHHRVGRDRLALSLAYFKSAMLDKSWRDLQECRAQLVDLYNTTAPNPFEF